MIDKVAAAGLDAQISIKPTQLGLDLDRAMCERNLERLIERAEQRGNFLWIDMESSPYVDPTLELYKRGRARTARIGIAIQAYLFRTAQGHRIADPARRRDPDRQGRVSRAAGRRVREEGRYRRELLQAVHAADGCRTRSRPACCCTSRPTTSRSPIGSTRGSPANKVPTSAYEFAMLYGIQRQQQLRLAREGKRLRVLISYGEFWFPWYMRRLAERPANVWFVLRNLK